ncbi:MAG: DUF6036 family nucleotidyltransferase [Acidimicrobiales bacterium]
MEFQREVLEEALETLGAILEARQIHYELLAIGGSSLLLLGLIDRPTGDLDVVALFESGAVHRLDELPEPLDTAAHQVATALGLSRNWLNTRPSSLMDFGLPLGWECRVITRQFEGLCLNLPGREDQICFKLYAAVDRGPNDKHFEDLKKLNPTAEELMFAARWTVTHDPSEAFRGELLKCLAELGVRVTDADV